MLKKEGFNYKEHPARERQEPVGAFCTWRTSGQESDTEKAWRIINQSGFVVFLWQNKAGWPVEYVSENAEALTGYGPREFMQGDVSYAAIIHPDDLSRVGSEVEKCRFDTSATDFTHAPYRIQARDGTTKWVADQTHILRNESGMITHYEGVVHDITQRVQAEAALKKSEQRLREEQELLKRILDATSEGIVYIDPAYRVVRANQVAADMCGLTPDAVEGKKCYEVFQNERCHTDACFLRCAGHEAPASEGEVRLSCRVDRAKEIPAFVAGRAVKDPAGKFAGVVESLRDLTEWKRAEQKTRQALQVKALAEGYAQMSGLLLHRMGNLLTPMQIEIERMQARGTEHALDYLEKAHEDLVQHLTDLSHYLQHDERGKEVFSFMEKAIRSLQKGEQDLSGQLREMASAVSRISEILTLQGQYAGKGYERREPLDLNAMIEDVLRMQSSMIEAKGLWVRKELAGGLPAVVMEPRHMQFLINSLIRNGWDRDRERDAGSEERWISVLTSKRNGTVCLEVQYVGCGSDWAETKALLQDGRISAGASDISLYFCKQLIEADNGTLSVERNGKGQGTSVQVLFGENA